jgi:RNA polymerase sigma-70 factor (ECF subfamily)
MEAMSEAISADVAAIVAAGAGDEVAFGRIVASHHDDMRRLCVFMTRDAALADDAVQNAWSTAWRKLGTLRDPASLRPWLMRLAANEAKRLIKQRGRRSEIEGIASPPSITAGPDPATGIERLDVLAALERLGPDDRALIALRYVIGFDAAAIAVASGMTPAAVRQRLKRLLDRLRMELAP